MATSTEPERMPQKEVLRRHVAANVKNSLEHLDALIATAEEARRIYGKEDNDDCCVPGHFIRNLRGHVESMAYAEAAAGALTMAGWFYPAEKKSE